MCKQSGQLVSALKETIRGQYFAKGEQPTIKKLETVKRKLEERAETERDISWRVFNALNELIDEIEYEMHR